MLAIENSRRSSFSQSLCCCVVLLHFSQLDCAVTKSLLYLQTRINTITQRAEAAFTFISKKKVIILAHMNAVEKICFLCYYFCSWPVPLELATANHLPPSTLSPPLLRLFPNQLTSRPISLHPYIFSLLLLQASLIVSSNFCSRVCTLSVHAPFLVKYVFVCVFTPRTKTHSTLLCRRSLGM